MNYRIEKVINVQDWDDLVIETYNRPYSLQQQDDCMPRQRIHISVPEYPDDYTNETVPEVVNGDKMGVSFQAWLNRDPEQKLDTDDEWDRENGLELWWHRNFYPDISMIINDLHKKGKIESGKYVIDIDW